ADARPGNPDRAAAAATTADGIRRGRLMTGSPLALSLAHAEALLSHARRSFRAPLALAASGDPYFIDLPVFNGGAAGTISRSALEVVAALYFVAEVEGTYLMSVGEELAEARFGLNLTDQEAAAKLEQLAAEMRGDWVDRGLRNQIFVRAFGIGHGDANLGDGMVNHEFEPRFARFCMAILEVARELEMGGWGGTGASARASVAAQSLLANLAQKIQGNTLIVTERLNAQLKLVIDALDHPGIATLFMGRNAWDVVRGVLGAETPDLQAHVNRAQAGLRILSWLAAHLGALRSLDSADAANVVRAEPALRGWAEIWLDAAGVPLQQQSAAAPYQRSWLQ
ncbi:MAG: hypothetical protein ACR2RE_29515, partial [Geminicoccaceae bacterium]